MDSTVINIVLPISSYYVPFFSVLLVSILKNASSDDKFCFYLISEDISKFDKLKIEECKKIKDFKIEYIIPDKNIIKDIPECKSSLINNICNYKLKLASLLPNLSKVLVLEGDMISISSLKELWNINLKNIPFMAVKDAIGLKFQKKLDIPTEYTYCNTGMFLANLDLWRKEHFEKRFNDAIIKYQNKLDFPDQDVFNIALYENIKYLNLKWNLFANLKNLNTEKQKEIDELLEKNDGIIHFAGSDKPWITDCNCSDLFWKYAELSPFYNEIFKRYLENKISQNVSCAFNYKKNIFNLRKYQIFSLFVNKKKKKRYIEKIRLLRKKILIGKKYRNGVI